MNKLALGIIDAQRGFMPAEEGERLGLPGFGELAVPGGQEIVPNINRLLGAFATHLHFTFTTQDWHPRETAHFSTTPDFVNNWPAHCVAHTPGAMLHPGIKEYADTEIYRKGDIVLTRGEDDTSYSAYNAHSCSGEKLPERLEALTVSHLYLAGLATDYCVGKSALDFRQKTDMDVTVIVDASRGIAPESTAQMLDQFKRNGINIATTEEVLAVVGA